MVQNLQPSTRTAAAMTGAVPGPRVYMLTETYRPEIGGGERQAALLSAGLAQRGCTVTLVVRRSRHRLPTREAEGAVRIRRLPPSGPGRLRKWLLILPVLLSARWKRRDYDVVLVSGFRLLGISALLAAIVTRRPTVLKADSSGEMSGEYFRTGLRSLGLSPEGGLAKFFLERRNALLRRADRFVCLSGEMRDEFIAPGSQSDRIVTIPNGVDTERFRPASARRAIGSAQATFTTRRTRGHLYGPTGPLQGPARIARGLAGRRSGAPRGLPGARR
jgi:glycosyltransferase involved in cell wall biosynthesis